MHSILKFGKRHLKLIIVLDHQVDVPAPNGIGSDVTSFISNITPPSFYLSNESRREGLRTSSAFPIPSVVI